MTLDQFAAVFYPFKHAKLRATLNKVMLIAFLVVGSTLAVMPFVLPELRIMKGYNRNIYLFVIASVFLIGLLVLLTAYPAVALKLYQQGRNVGQHLGHRGRVMVASDETETMEKTAAMKRAMYIRALKIYTSLFIAFIAA